MCGCRVQKDGREQLANIATPQYKQKRIRYPAITMSLMKCSPRDSWNEKSLDDSRELIRILVGV